VCASFCILISLGFDPAKMNPQFPEPYRIDLSVTLLARRVFPRFEMRQSHLSFKGFYVETDLPVSLFAKSALPLSPAHGLCLLT
jgi:hypothetical protein